MPVSLVFRYLMEILHWFLGRDACAVGIFAAKPANRIPLHLAFQFLLQPNRTQEQVCWTPVSPYTLQGHRSDEDRERKPGGEVNPIGNDGGNQDHCAAEQVSAVGLLNLSNAVLVAIL